jgi:hypothetical protein
VRHDAASGWVENPVCGVNFSHGSVDGTRILLRRKPRLNGRIPGSPGKPAKARIVTVSARRAPVKAAMTRRAFAHGG